MIFLTMFLVRNGIFKKLYKNVVGFSYLLVLVITKIITIFEN